MIEKNIKNIENHMNPVYNLKTLKKSIVFSVSEEVEATLLVYYSLPMSRNDLRGLMVENDSNIILGYVIKNTYDINHINRSR